MWLERPGARLVGASVGMLLVLVASPVVPVSNSVLILGNYMPGADQCTAVNETAAFQACLASYQYPAVKLNSTTSAAYLLSGLGQPPYPSYALVNQGHAAVLVHYSGARVGYVEGPFGGPLVLNPVGVVSVEDPLVSTGPNGMIEFSALVKNVGTAAVLLSGVYYDYPGYGYNTTFGGSVWHHSLAPQCGEDLLPGSSCSVDYSTYYDTDLGPGTAHELTWVVVGTSYSISTPTSSTGGVDIISVGEVLFGNFVVVDTTQAVYPASNANPIDMSWVEAFIGVVDSKRIGAPLAEDQALDQFAQLRFETVMANYTVSDYGFDRQAQAYLRGSGTPFTEEILYPSGSPEDFANYLRVTAPGHWQGLLDTGYLKYGYYIGVGPAVVVASNCPVSEVTQHNVNITQLVIDNGCSFEVDQVTYLVIVLSG